MEQLIKVRRKPAEISIKDTNAGFSVAKRKERCSGSEIIMISDHCATLPFYLLSHLISAHFFIINHDSG